MTLSILALNLAILDPRNSHLEGQNDQVGGQNGQNEAPRVLASATNSAKSSGVSEEERNVLADELEEFRQLIMAAPSESTEAETPDSGGAASSSKAPVSTEAHVPPAPPPHATAKNIESKRLEARRRDHCMFHRSLCSPDVDCAGCLAKTRN